MAMELLSPPRVSLSHDQYHLSSSPTFTGSSFRLDDVSQLPVDSGEFDFSSCTSSYEAASSTPADLLFSQGKLLPLYNICDQVDDDNYSSTSSDSRNKQLLNIGRSSSVSSSTKTAGAAAAACHYFPRSKSTGCSLINPTKTLQLRLSESGRSSSAKGKGKGAMIYYYCGDHRRSGGVVSTYGGDGVRINPVINVPPASSFIPRGGSSGGSSTSTTTTTTTTSSGGGRSRSTSFFAYLLCNCTGKIDMEI